MIIWENVKWILLIFCFVLRESIRRRLYIIKSWILSSAEVLGKARQGLSSRSLEGCLSLRQLFARKHFEIDWKILLFTAQKFELLIYWVKVGMRGLTMLSTVVGYQKTLINFLPFRTFPIKTWKSFSKKTGKEQKSYIDSYFLSHENNFPQNEYLEDCLENWNKCIRLTEHGKTVAVESIKRRMKIL